MYSSISGGEHVLLYSLFNDYLERRQLNINSINDMKFQHSYPPVEEDISDEYERSLQTGQHSKQVVKGEAVLIDGQEAEYPGNG